MSYYREQLEQYLKTLDINTNVVFDFGGKQKPVKGRTKSWNVKDYEIFDIPEYNLENKLELGKNADIIFCLEVFEYLIEPVTAMRNIKNHLKSNGMAIISFPLIYPLHNEVEFDSLRYTISGIKRIVEKCNLKIDKVSNRRTKTGNLVKYYQDDGMKSAKGFDHNITGYIINIVHE